MHLQIVEAGEQLPCGMWQTDHTARQCGSGYQKAAVRAEPNKRLEC